MKKLLQNLWYVGPLFTRQRDLPMVSCTLGHLQGRWSSVSSSWALPVARNSFQLSLLNWQSFHSEVHKREGRVLRREGRKVGGG